MKNLLILTVFFFLSLSLFGQSPDKMSYQAVIRDNNNNLVVNTQIGMKISILQYSPSGAVVFSELHSPTSNSNGLVNIIIGSGPFQNGTFSSINWADGPYFITTETDITGGTNYTLTGTSQLLSVPYASYANKSRQADIEIDPVYSSSLAAGITDADTIYWNNKLDAEIDGDTTNEIQVLNISNDTIFLSNGGFAKLPLETDPVFDSSIAAAITIADTTFWNNKSDFDGNYSNLTNAPDIANSTDEKTIHLNTNDATSSVNITKNNGTSVFKVDGTGRMTGDGSGLSNVKSLINYVGGNQRHQVTSNYGSYDNVRSVTLTVPASGVCFAIASGYCDWESTGWDLYLGGILMDQDPNSSWAAENEWYSYLNIITDYNCTDSSDQYTSFTQQRCFPVGAGTHTFTLWVNKYSSSSKTELGDVNLSVMYFPTGGTGKTPEVLEMKSEEVQQIDVPVPNTVSGHH